MFSLIIPFYINLHAFKFYKPLEFLQRLKKLLLVITYNNVIPQTRNLNIGNNRTIQMTAVEYIP